MAGRLTARHRGRSPSCAAATAAVVVAVALFALLCAAPGAAADGALSSTSPSTRRAKALASASAGLLKSSAAPATNFGMSFLGSQSIIVANSATKSGSNYCFEVSHIGGAGAGSCDPLASTCCTTNAPVTAVNIASVQIFLSNECAVSMTTELSGFKATLTAMPGGLGQAANITKRTSATLSKNADAGVVSIKKAWKGAAELCIFVPEIRRSGPCGSMEKLCGPDGCAIVATTAPFKHSNASNAVAKACRVTADVPVEADACARSPCDPNAVCTNTVGGYRCECKPKFAGDGKTCVYDPICSTVSVSGHGSPGSSVSCTDGLIRVSNVVPSAVELAETTMTVVPKPGYEFVNSSSAVLALRSSESCGDGSVYSDWFGSRGTATVVSTKQSLDVCAAPCHSPVYKRPVALAAGNRFTSVLQADGSVVYFGGEPWSRAAGGSPVPTPIPGLESGVSAIAAVFYHLAAIKADGSLWTWGRNEYGELGVPGGTGQYKSAAIPVPDLSANVTTVAAGDSFTCALQASGRLKCWGRNQYGQLGIDNQAMYDTSTPTEVAGPYRYRSVVAGRSHACALTMESKVACWGYGGWGQLGLNSYADLYSPQLVPGLGDVAELSAGNQHTCARKRSGAVLCWGAGGQGALGNGGTADKLVPTPVTGFESSGAKAVFAFGYATFIVKSDGSAVAVGYNAQGQLGLGHNNNVLSPTPHPDFGADAPASFIGGNYLHTCAVRATTGAIYCMGSNQYGQLAQTSTGSGVTFSTPQDTNVVAALPSDSFARVRSTSTGEVFSLNLRLVTSAVCSGA